MSEIKIVKYAICNDCYGYGFLEFSRYSKGFKSDFVIKTSGSLDNLSKHYDMAYAYLQDGEAIGFLGLANYRKRPVVLNKEVFMEMMGGFAGKVSYKAISAALGKLNVTDPLMTLRGFGSCILMRLDTE